MIAPSPRVVASFLCAALFLAPARLSAQQYDLLLQKGHVLDDKNHRDGIMDVAIKDGKIAAVAAHLSAKSAIKTVDCTGLYVTPGLIDIHVHVFAGTGEKGSYAGDNSVYPDGFTFRSGVTTVADAGSSGAKNFEDFKQRIIDRSQTRVLAFLNIVGAGMRGPKYEDNLDDMDGQLAGHMALKYPGLIIGIKTAHFDGPEWKPVDQAVIAGTIAHMYSGLRDEQDPKSMGPSAGMLIGRKRGIFFDVGHGDGSFKWSVATPLVKAGFIPDSISTDLHITSMNAGMKDELNVADKMLALGQTVPQIIAEMTSHPAHEIQHEELGNLTVGNPADVAVLRLEHGRFGFYDMINARQAGTEKLTCELTVHNGKVVYDLNGLTSDTWNHPPTSDASQAKKWTTMNTRASGPPYQAASREGDKVEKSDEKKH